MKKLIPLMILLVAMTSQLFGQFDIYAIDYTERVETLEDAPSGKICMTEIGPVLIYRKSDRYIPSEIAHVYNSCKQILEELGLDIEDPDNESGIEIEAFGPGSDAAWVLIASGNAHCYREWFVETEPGLHTAMTLVLDENGIYFQAYKTVL